jgi:hypothetical protein
MEGMNEELAEAELAIISFIETTDYPFEGNVEISVIPRGFGVLKAALIRDYGIVMNDMGGIDSLSPGPFFSILLDNGFDVKYINENGNNYLHLIAYEIESLMDRIELAREEEDNEAYEYLRNEIMGLVHESDVLVNAGINPYIKNEFEYRPFDIYGRLLPKYMEYIRIYSTLVNSGNPDLHIVANMGNMRLYNFLNG